MNCHLNFHLFMTIQLDIINSQKLIKLILFNYFKEFKKLFTIKIYLLKKKYNCVKYVLF